MNRLGAFTLVLSQIPLSLLSQPHPPCSVLSDAKRSDLTSYVRNKYKLPDSVTLALSQDIPIAATCVHQLNFQGTGPLKSWELTLYLSADGRYLTSDLFDTSVDPVEEERTKLHALMADLSQNKGASLGPEHAPVTIVEFSDFQCPYCRKFAETIQEVLPAEGNRIRVVFHHMPLSIHPWARIAAEGAACAQLQGNTAFWSVHNALFHRQNEITLDNIKPSLIAIAESTPQLDLKAFKSCLDDQMSLGIVLRDADLASANQVNATPTLFVNGHRLQGIRDAAQLREVIAEALEDQAGARDKTAKGSAGIDRTN